MNVDNLLHLTVTIGTLIKILVGLLVAASPSVVVALTDYPQAQSAWSGFLRLLQPVSALEHRDGFGTFKKLGRRARPPVTKVVSASEKVTPPSGTTAIVLVLIACVMSLSCTPAQRSKIASDVSACAIEPLADAAAAAALDVQRAIESKDYKAEFEAVAKRRGIDAALCATLAVAQDLAKFVRGRTERAVTGLIRERISHADEILDSYGVKRDTRDGGL